MQFLYRLLLNIKQYPLSWRLLAYVVFCSSIFALLATAVQLYLDYRRDVSALYDNLNFIEKSYLDGIAASTFKIDTEHLTLELDGALGLPGIVYLEVRESRGNQVYTYSRGNREATHIIRKEYPLEYVSPAGQKRRIGTLVANASLAVVYQRLWSRVLTILATNIAKTFLASACILAIIYALITRHLMRMAEYTRHLAPGSQNHPLTLNRRSDQTDKPDELGHVAVAINDLQARVAADIVKQRQAALKYRTVADFTYDWEYWADFDGKLNYVSPSCERISGYTAQEFIDDPSLFRKIIAPEDQGIWDQHYRDSRTKLIPRELQFRIQRRDGEIRWIVHVCQPVYDDDGNPNGFRASNRDNTERKRFEEDLVQSKNFNQSTLDSLTYHIAVLDKEGNILGVNQSWQQFARQNNAESLDRLGCGMNYLDVCRRSSDTGNESALTALDGIQSVLAGTREEFAMEYPCDSPAEKRWFLMRVVPFSGRKGGVIVSHSDITDRKLAEIELKAAYTNIKQLKERLEAETEYLQEEIRLEQNFENIIGNSAAIKYVLFKIEQVAVLHTAVLILGETGTGKELVARAIHENSLRKDKPLIKVNCAALPSSLIESELFGHEKGAFTGALQRKVGRFELADGASIFLDEVGELPLDLQVKLLGVLQDGRFERLGGTGTIQVDVRVIAATNRNLAAEVRNGLFREDLFYRLNIFPITVPPLRERIKDIPLLVEYFVARASKRVGKSIEQIPVGVMKTLQNYHWPGNIRELENVIERAVIHTSGPKLRLAEKLELQQERLPALKSLEAVEYDHILRVLEQTNWKISGEGGAAEILGLKRGTLRARIQKLGIRKP